METCRTPPRCRSPSVPRRPSKFSNVKLNSLFLFFFPYPLAVCNYLTYFSELTVPEIQQMLGDAVNNIVKYYYKSEKEVRMLLFYDFFSFLFKIIISYFFLIFETYFVYLL